MPEKCKHCLICVCTNKLWIQRILTCLSRKCNVSDVCTCFSLPWFEYTTASLLFCDGDVVVASFQITAFNMTV